MSHPQTIPQSPPSAWTGQRLAIATIALVWTVSVLQIVWSPGATGLRDAILLTARAASLLFLPAYVASAVARLRPSHGTRRLLANRRYLGIAFGFVMLFHYLLLVFYAQIAPAAFRAATPLSVVIIGGSASVLLVLMTATSFNRIRKSVSTRSWKTLHRLGAHAIWFTFIVAYYMHLKDGLSPPFEAAIFLALIAALLLRIFAWIHGLATATGSQREAIGNGEIL